MFYLTKLKILCWKNLKLVRLLPFDAELKPNCFLWNTVATVLTSRKLQRRKILEKLVKSFNNFHEIQIDFVSLPTRIEIPKMSQK